MLEDSFFDQDACELARNLLGKVIYRKIHGLWVKVRIIETEAYYISEKASHSSKGFTASREAMFMPAGTIYMYYARGRASLNISAQGEGNAVLIKSGYPYLVDTTAENEAMLKVMRQQYDDSSRDINKLCNGQTLLCQSLGLLVPEWNKKNFDKNKLYIKDENITPNEILVTTRLGIPVGRDEHLPYRFIDADFLKWCTKPARRQTYSVTIYKTK